MIKTIYIIVPVFNEEKTIKTVLDELLALYSNCKIIVVDDGSFDNTPEVIKSINHPNLIKLRNPTNSGKGSAMIRGLNGIEETLDGIVIFCDSDLEIGTNQIQKIINAYHQNNDHQAIFGSRFLHSNNFNIFGFKFIINYLLTFLSNKITSTQLTDMETALKSFKTDLIKKMDLTSNGFDIEPEIVFKLSKLNILIHEVPIEYSPRSKSEGKKMSIKGGLVTLRALLKFSFQK